MQGSNMRHAQERPRPRTSVWWVVAGVVLALVVASPFVYVIFGNL